MRFSNRIPNDLTPNEFADGLKGVPPSELIDLTQSNPSRCRIAYPDGIPSLLARPENLEYSPEPFGSLSARRALADYLATRGEKVDPGNILLTASTSEAYSLLFRVLADAGDVVHFPHPGYPLIEYLARLDALEPVPYRLLARDGWPLDRETLIGSLGDRSRALVAIRPHNPTGSWFDPEDALFFREICGRHGLALLSDEVFADFVTGDPMPCLDWPEILSFRLGGLSKSLGLPGWKLSWVLMDGPRKDLEEARERLEFASDAYLSANTPVQAALKDLLGFASVMRDRIADRIRTNRARLERTMEPLAGVRVWPSGGGWYALIGLPSGRNADALSLEALEKASLAVHPGGFYGLEDGFLVVSLLPEPDEFVEGVRRLVRLIEGTSGE